MVCKEFFQPHRIKSHKPQSTSIRHADGFFTTSDVVEIRDITSSFYHHLLNVVPISRNKMSKRDYVWVLISNRVSSQM